MQCDKEEKNKLDTTSIDKEKKKYMYSEYDKYLLLLWFGKERAEKMINDLYQGKGSQEKP